MKWFTLSAILLTAGMAYAGDLSDLSLAPSVTFGKDSTAPQERPAYLEQESTGGFLGGLFQSDAAFPRFIGPISNPALAKDPRSLTELQVLYVYDKIPDNNLFSRGDFNLYGAQARVALTDRLSFIADKDGYLEINPKIIGKRYGLVNVAAGAKYLFIRDVPNQFLLSGGVMVEPPTGSASVFQGHGDVLATGFVTVGKEFATDYHVLGNAGYQFPIGSIESSFLYASVHADKRCFGWLYPLVEVNWFHYTSGGRTGIPHAVGEGDGLVNLGTAGVAGEDLVTGAVGVKAHITDHIEIGGVYEHFLTDRRYLIDNRVVAVLILRY